MTQWPRPALVVVLADDRNRIRWTDESGKHMDTNYKRLAEHLRPAFIGVDEEGLDDVNTSV